VGFGIFLAVSAVAPSLLLGWYFHKRDLYPEPGRVLWATFGLGVLTVALVLPVELLMGAVMERIEGAVGRGAADAFLVAALPEETLKLLVLLGYSYRHRSFNEPMDGIIYGVMASLGFATLENALYVMDGGLGTALMRAFTSVPSHATWGAVMGYFVGRARFAPAGRLGLIFSGFFTAVTLHGLYDFPLLSLDAAGKVFGPGAVPGRIMALLPLSLVMVAVSIGWALLLTRKVRREQAAFRAPALAGTAPPLNITAPPASPSRTVGALMLAFGFILAAGGGMLTLGSGLVMVLGGVEAEELIYALIFVVITGVFPMLGGILLFGLGIKRLNQARPASFYYGYYQPPPLRRA
jgi:RsiW-degrading membrane proteinase PrsW (M82 family)